MQCVFVVFPIFLNGSKISYRREIYMYNSGVQGQHSHVSRLCKEPFNLLLRIIEAKA